MKNPLLIVLLGATLVGAGARSLLEERALTAERDSWRAKYLEARDEVEKFEACTAIDKKWMLCERELP